MNSRTWNETQSPYVDVWYITTSTLDGRPGGSYVLVGCLYGWLPDSLAGWLVGYGCWGARWRPELRMQANQGKPASLHSERAPIFKTNKRNHVLFQNCRVLLCFHFLWLMQKLGILSYSKVLCRKSIVNHDETTQAGFPQFPKPQFPKPQFPSLRSQPKDPKLKFQTKTLKIPKLKFWAKVSKLNFRS